MPPRQLQLAKGNCLITSPGADPSRWATSCRVMLKINCQGRLLQTTCTTFHAAALNTGWISYITLACHRRCTSGTSWFPSGSICSKIKLHFKRAQWIIATAGLGGSCLREKPLKNVDHFLGGLNTSNTEVSLHFALVPQYHWKGIKSKCIFKESTLNH